MKKVIIRIVSMFMLLVTFFTIYRFSAQNAEESGGISNKVTTIIINNFPYTKNLNINTRIKLIEHTEPIVRKLAHFSIYTVVGMFIMLFMCTFPLKLRTKLTTSLLVGLVYAISDEYHQSFVPRTWFVLDRCVYRYIRCLYRNTYYFSIGFDLYCIKKR